MRIQKVEDEIITMLRDGLPATVMRKRLGMEDMSYSTFQKNVAKYRDPAGKSLSGTMSRNHRKTSLPTPAKPPPEMPKNSPDGGQPSREHTGRSEHGKPEHDPRKRRPYVETGTHKSEKDDVSFNPKNWKDIEV